MSEEESSVYNTQLVSMVDKHLVKREENDTIYCSADYHTPLYDFVCQLTHVIEEATNVNLDMAYKLLQSVIDVMYDMSEDYELSELIYQEAENDCMYTHDCIGMLYDGVMYEWANEKITEGATTIVQAVTMSYTEALEQSVDAVLPYFERDSDEYETWAIPVVDTTEGNTVEDVPTVAELGNVVE